MTSPPTPEQLNAKATAIAAGKANIKTPGQIRAEAEGKMLEQPQPRIGPRIAK